MIVDFDVEGHERSLEAKYGITPHSEPEDRKNQVFQNDSFWQNIIFPLLQRVRFKSWQ